VLSGVVKIHNNVHKKTGELTRNRKMTAGGEMTCLFRTHNRASHTCSCEKKGKRRGVKKPQIQKKGKQLLWVPNLEWHKLGGTKNSLERGKGGEDWHSYIGTEPPKVNLATLAGG